MICGSSTQLRIKETFELARLVAQSRKYERQGGWAAVNQLSGDDQAESGSLLENDCFDDSSSTMRTALSWYHINVFILPSRPYFIYLTLYVQTKTPISNKKHTYTLSKKMDLFLQWEVFDLEFPF